MYDGKGIYFDYCIRISVFAAGNPHLLGQGCGGI
jgi:hypothetical protein